jgi:hypothetical protein
MAPTTTSCPRCRQPVRAEIEQLFDMNIDPKAKQRLLSGAANRIHCPSCGYEGQLATPIVYHDPEKELLLTYFPPELGLPVNEQERLIGPLITQVTNKLPPEKRKAYLFRPQTMFTYDLMIEKVLEGDGITRDMLQAQQARLNLLQRLMSTKPESRADVIRQEAALIDQDFFNLLSRLMEATLAQGDQNSARAIAALQQDLVTNTELGQKLAAQAKDADAAVKALQEASKSGLTREKLLDMMAAAPSDTYLSSLVSMTRSGLDYSFFQILSERIDKAAEADKAKLTELREKLLSWTQEIDKAIQEQSKAARALLEEILKAPDIEKAFTENAEAIDDFFVEVLKSEHQAARQKGDLARSAKLDQIISIIQQMSTPPQEYALVEQLMEAGDDGARRKLLDEHAAEVTPEFVQMLASLASQSEAQGQPPEIVAEFEKIYSMVVRFTMEANLKK